MSEPRVQVFFYGSFINREVLAQTGFVPERFRVARLPGFAIQIRPLANLVRSQRDTVYGILCEATHADLARLYEQDWVGTYLPEAVLVEVSGQGYLPALCYIAPDSEPAPATSDYIDRIVGPAREYGFPEWYVEQLESFRPGPRG